MNGVKNNKSQVSDFRFQMIQERPPDRRQESAPASFSLMTYNVHSCRGSDGTFSPERIADVIVRYTPDVVCLQELDVLLVRSNTIDQTRTIAEIMSMDYHFHPSFQIEKGWFGNAVLSRFPMHIVKTGELPTLRSRRLLEKRGAMKVEIRTGEQPVTILNTHLGLNYFERLRQIDTLLGPEWYGNPQYNSPVIFCGDFNASPLSYVYQRLGKKLIDVQKYIYGHRPRKTWPSRLPLLRIDHIFVNNSIRVKNVIVPRDKTTRSASDHLPVIARLEIP